VDQDSLYLEEVDIVGELISDLNNSQNQDKEHHFVLFPVEPFDHSIQDTETFNDNISSAHLLSIADITPSQNITKDYSSTPLLPLSNSDNIIKDYISSSLSTDSENTKDYISSPSSFSTTDPIPNLSQKKSNISIKLTKKKKNKINN